MEKFIDIVEAIRIVKSEGIVAVPTETVYGIAASAYSQLGCDKIFQIKKRSKKNPLIVHCSSIIKAKEIAIFDDLSEFLASKFSPGPISFVLPISNKSEKKIAPNVTAGLSTICIRIPSHETIRELIHQIGPIASPSANISTRVTGVHSDHIEEDFGDSLKVVLGDQEIGGLESTIVRCQKNYNSYHIDILRSGYISIEDIKNAIEGSHFDNITSIKHSTTTKIVTPGMMFKHYSTRAPLMINAKSNQPNTVAINFGKSNLSGKYIYNLSPSGCLFVAAKNLYSIMRKADIDVQNDSTVTHIALAAIPRISIGHTINDRLEKASQ